MQRLIAALLRRATDAELAESILGDLAETRRKLGNPRRTRFWYYRELFAITVRAIGERVAGAFRDSPVGSQLNGSRGDLRYAFRSLGSRPWYAGAVIGVIALSMALAMTVFAIVDGVLFKPLPYVKPGELYRVSGGYQRGQASGVIVAPRNLRDWSSAVPGSEIAAYREEGSSVTLGDLRSWAPTVAAVDGGFFQVLGVRPLVGGFSDEDFDGEQQPQPAIIGYGIWQSVFGGRADVIDQTFAVGSARRFLVRGVLPRDFIFPSRSGGLTNVLVPIVTPKDRQQDLRYRRVYGIARLPPSESLDSQQARMDGAAKAEAIDWVPRRNDGSPVFDRAGLEPLET